MTDLEKLVIIVAVFSVVVFISGVIYLRYEKKHKQRKQH